MRIISYRKTISVLCCLFGVVVYMCGCSAGKMPVESEKTVLYEYGTLSDGQKIEDIVQLDSSCETTCIGWVDSHSFIYAVQSHKLADGGYIAWNENQYVYSHEAELNDVSLELLRTYTAYRD